MVGLAGCGEFTDGLKCQADSSYSLDKKRETKSSLEWGSIMRKYPFKDSKENVYCSMQYE